MYATLAQYFCVALKETICKFFLETRGVLLPLYWKIFLQSKGLHSKDEGKLLTRLVIDIDGLVSSSLLKYAFHIQSLLFWFWLIWKIILDLPSLIYKIWGNSLRHLDAK